MYRSLRFLFSGLCIAILLGVGLATAGENQTDIFVGKWLYKAYRGKAVMQIDRVEADGSVRGVYAYQGKLYDFSAKATAADTVNITLHPSNSTYKLKYHEGSDQLRGTFWHAQTNRTQDVYFERLPPEKAAKQ